MGMLRLRALRERGRICSKLMVNKGGFDAICSHLLATFSVFL